MSSTLPEPTKTRRGAAWASQLQTTDTIHVPGVDGARLSRKYGMERAHQPRLEVASFHAPVAATPAQWDQVRNSAVMKFIEVMGKRGWDLWQPGRIRVVNGVYPARDMLSGKDLLDEREYLIRAYFTFRNPQPLRLELPPRLLEPQTFTR